MQAQAERVDSPSPKPTSPSKEPVTPHNLPPRNQKFAGREDDLEELHARLRSSAAVGITQPRDRSEQCGIGKSALAFEYGWRHLSDFPGGVFVINCRSGLVSSEVAKLAEAVGVKPDGNQRTTALRVRKKLGAEQRSLLILDNLDDSDVWRKVSEERFLPAGKIRCLITSGRGLRNVEMHALEPLAPEEGRSLLAKYRADAGQPANEAAVKDVVSWYEGVPMSLVIVGSYMSQHADQSWDDCLKELSGKSRADNAVALFDELLETFSPQHRRALEYSSLLPEHHVPTRWLIDLMNADPSTPFAKLLGDQVRPPHQVLSSLVRAQLLQPLSNTTQILSLHPLLRRRFHELLDAEEEHRDGLWDSVIRQSLERTELCNEVPEKVQFSHDVPSLLALSLELFHLGRLEDAVRLVRGVAHISHRLGWHDEIVATLSVFCEPGTIDKVDPSDAAVLLSDAAVSLAAIGDLEAARSRLQHAIQIELKHLGSDHPALATRYSNLAAILKQMGDLAKARRHIEQAIQIEKKHFSEDHPNLAIRYWWLADIELADGKTREACNQFRRAQEILLKQQDADHPQVQALQKLIDTHSAS